MNATSRRRPRAADQLGRYAVLSPLVAEAARRAGASSVGLIDVGHPAGLNLAVDLVRIEYDHHTHLGPSASPVRRTASVAKRSTMPRLPVPQVAARVVLDDAPLDVSDPEAVERLLAGVPAAAAELPALREEMALLATVRRALVSGTPADRLVDAIATVPRPALPIVMTTWTLSRYPPPARQRFWDRLGEASRSRAVGWVSVEGVGVAPHVPTLGDRPASGHSILGVALFSRSGSRVDAVGRCWSRGRMIEWLGER